MQLKPNDTEILNFVGDFYTATDHPSALEIEMEALNLDPLHPVKHADVAFTYLNLGNWEKVGEYTSNCLRLDSSFVYAASNWVRALVADSDLETASKVINSYQDVIGLNKIYLIVMKAELAAAKGDSEEFSVIMSKLKAAAENDEFSFGRLAELYLHANMLEEAASMIERGYDHRDQWLTENIYFISLPEEMPDHPALQAALNKPELNALFEIRRKNRKLKESDSQN